MGGAPRAKRTQRRVQTWKTTQAHHPKTPPKRPKTAEKWNKNGTIPPISAPNSAISTPIPKAKTPKMERNGTKWNGSKKIPPPATPTGARTLIP